MEYCRLTRELRDISRSEDRLWPGYRGLMRS